MASAGAAKKLRVLIGGGSGFIGHHLKNRLVQNGHTVSIISRTPGPGRVTWDDIKQKNALPIEVDACVQLTGANIMEQKWTPERKAELRESRIGLTQILTKAIKNTPKAPSIFVSGSAIGYYPDNIDGEYDEYYNGPPGQGFSSTLVADWEKSSEELAPLLRRSLVRTGVVLSRGEGALKSMVLPFGLAVAGTIGSGQQWMSWIHIEDLVEMFAFAIENDAVSGVLNGVAPGAATNAQFSAALANAAGRYGVPTPEFLANLMFGERAPLLTRGSKIVPRRALELGFQFKHPNLQPALNDVFSK